jgi:hypothetical protein
MSLPGDALPPRNSPRRATQTVVGIAITINRRAAERSLGVCVFVRRAAAMNALEVGLIEEC